MRKEPTTWYMDNNNYLTKDFVDTFIENFLKSVVPGDENKTVENVKGHYDCANPAAPLTCARDFGLFRNDEMGDSTKLYNNQTLSFAELVFELIFKRSAYKDTKSNIKPAVLICKYFDILNNIDDIEEEKKFITSTECYKFLCIIDEYDECDEEYVRKVIQERNYSPQNPELPIIDRVPNNVYITSLFNSLCDTGLFAYGKKKGIIRTMDIGRDLIHYIAENGSNISIAPIKSGANSSNVYDYLGNINKGVLEIIPEINLSQEIEKQDVRGAFEFLFGIGIRNSFDWKKYFSTNVFAIYKPLFIIKNIAITKIYLNNATSGELLFDYAKSSDYKVLVKEKKVMILPFAETEHTSIEELLVENDKFDGLSLSDNTYLSKEWFHEKGNEYLDDDLKAKKAYEEFQSKYSIEYLKNLHGEEMLKAIFLGITDDNLCNALEFDSKYTQFGSISGGTSYKYYLYFSKNEGTWRTSFGNGGKRACTVEEAIEIGTQIRDALVLGIEAIIEKEEFSTIGDYTEVLNTLETIIPDYVSRMWVLKYFHMMFPNVFPNFYNESWQRFVLCNLGIVPSDSQFIRMGQINLFVKECEISNYVFSQVFYENCGSPKTFFRIGTGEDGCYFNEWKEQEYAAIGWNELGDLSALYENEEAAKATIIENLKEDYNYQPNLASKKYKEINNFYSAVTNETYVVAMNGQKILGIGLIVGNYYYDDEKDDKYAHCRKIKWVNVLSQPQTLPNPNEGKLTTFYPLVNGENLCFLYDLINHSNVEENLESAFADAEAAKSKVTFNTGYTSEFARNRILFGAPGTGKSFTLNGDRKEILYGDREADETKLDLTQYGEYERVTFHPDYSYANFVGTYKPVPCEDGITYEYVPGPFMRTYVKALLNSKTETPKPYLLIIEEINRANVAAVFGDVFQLLDRGEDEVSEYPIQASEDMKKYLAKKLGGDPKDYEEIRIPDNMFIWATMNSADQGVFPMDTAFKRRWDFTYLGIDDSEDGISGKTVVLGKGKQNSRIVEWNELRKAINEELLKYKVNEDKLMGPYFISKKNLPEGKIIDPEEFSRIFKNKVIMYLFDDAAKQKRTTLFEGCEEKSRNQYSKICNEFDEKGVLIFGSSISDKFTVIPEDDEQ